MYKLTKKSGIVENYGGGFVYIVKIVAPVLVFVASVIDRKLIKCFLLLKYFDKFDIIQTAYIAKNELLSEVL